MADTNANYDRLLADFLPPAEARQAAEDIRFGDRLLAEHPAPRPDAALLADINVRVAAALVTRRRRQVIRRFGRAAAAAAAVIVFGGMLFFFSGDAPEHGAYHIAGTLPPDPPAWIADWWGDSAVQTLSAQVDEVVETLISISVEDTFVENHVPDFDEAELEELEAIAANDDFWKG